MERAAVSAATGAMKPVLGKLTSLLGDEHTLPEGSRSDIGFIVSELEPTHSLLVRLWEAEGLDVACKGWMMELRELSYDMEDAIDDFIQQRTNTSPFEDLKIKVKDVSERLCEKWKTAETISNSSKPVVDPRARFLHKDASELVGMDELKDKLIELLVQRVDKRRDASRRRIGIPHHGTTQMKQKIVIKVQMSCDKCRFKAMALVASTGGVDSVELAGLGKDQVVVVGEGVDSIKLTSALRKKVGPAQLVQVVDAKQKIVIKVQMANDKSRAKAVALVAATRGVDSVALAGEGKDQVVVVGDDVDPVQLTSALRKKVGPAQLVPVGEAKNVEEKRPAIVAVVDYPSQPVAVNAVNEHPATAYGYQQFGELKIVCILGFAGVGKTTLADLLYHAIGEQFQCRAFVSVSPSPNMMEVLIAILTELTNEPYGGATEAAAEQSLIHSISNFLADKRYLVIIDDIWHWEECEIIRKSLPKNNLGSRIIMTTRINALAEKCRTTNDAIVYEIKGLTAYAAEVLSERIISGYRKVKFIHQPIAHMCGGFPSAVICMSLALEEQLQRHSMSTATRVEFKVALRRVRDGFLNIPCLQPLLESLSLGYHDLPLHLKACLLHCSICPDYYRFERDSLVSKWIAEGFVHEEGAAEGCFDELVNRRLIEMERDSEYDIHTSSEKKYKIHTIMLDFLRCKSQQHNFVTCLGHETDISSLHTTRRIRRLSLQYQPDPVDFSRMDLSHARSLYVFDAASAVPFKRFERLRVLDLEYAEDLENAHLVDICGLLWLRYLGLKGTPISKLPPQIGRLQHLETLDVSGTKVSELPPEIGTLLHLKTLDVSGTKVSELPPEIGTLQHLETLDVSGTKVSELPPEIGTLQHLETLDVRNTMVSELPWEAGQISKSVRVLAGDEDSRQGVKLPEGVCQALKNGIPESSLAKCREVLSIVVFDRFGMGTVPPQVGVFKVPSRHMHIPWLIKEHFSVLSSLDIRLCKLDTEGGDLKFLREMPNLLTLVVRFEVLPREPITISGEGFAMLESFCVDSRVPRVTFGQGAMPNLKRLAFKFYAGPAGEDHVGITHLRSLEKVVFRCSPWYKSDSPGISATVAVVRREAGEHPNRITLCINDDEEEIFPEKDSAQICQENRGAGSCSGTEADKLDDDRNSLAGNDNTEETFQAENFARCCRTSEIEEIEA